jgi:hypothetical protein
MDLPTLGANPKQSQSECETQEAKDLGNLQWPRQTVRMEGGTIRGHQADHPRAHGGLSENGSQISAKNGPSVPYPWTV